MNALHAVLDAARLLGGPGGKMAAGLTEVLHTCHEWNTLAAGEAGAVMYVNDAISQILSAIERGMAEIEPHGSPTGRLPYPDGSIHEPPLGWAGQGFAGPPEEPEPDMSPEARARVRAALDAADPVRGKGRDLRA
jgi:hypothetical protein